MYFAHNEMADALAPWPDIIFIAVMLLAATPFVVVAVMAAKSIRRRTFEGTIQRRARRWRRRHSRG